MDRRPAYRLHDLAPVVPDDTDGAALLQLQKEETEIASSSRVGLSRLPRHGPVEADGLRPPPDVRRSGGAVSGVN